MAGTLTRLKPIVLGGQNFVGFARAGYVNARVIGASTAESFTVPSGAKWVNFSATVAFYADFVTTAVVPATDVTDGSSPVLNPGLRGLEGAETISVISASAGVITAEFFK